MTFIEHIYLFLLRFGGDITKEATFQRKLKEELMTQFPGCLVLKNDSGYIQGIPDLVVFCGQKWAMLECKVSADAEHQPNQDYYVEELNKMGFARFVYPENRVEVINELRRYFEEY